MRIDILTVLPELLASPLQESILGRAQAKGLVEIHVHNLRDHTDDKRRTTDDYPFGGEAGMVMKPEPIFRCITQLQSERTYEEVIYLSRWHSVRPTGSQPIVDVGQPDHSVWALQGDRLPHS